MEDSWRALPLPRSTDRGGMDLFEAAILATPEEAPGFRIPDSPAAREDPGSRARKNLDSDDPAERSDVSEA